MRLLVLRLDKRESGEEGAMRVKRSLHSRAEHYKSSDIKQMFSLSLFSKRISHIR